MQMRRVAQVTCPARMTEVAVVPLITAPARQYASCTTEQHIALMYTAVQRQNACVTTSKCQTTTVSRAIEYMLHQLVPRASQNNKTAKQVSTASAHDE